MGIPLRLNRKEIRTLEMILTQINVDFAIFALNIYAWHEETPTITKVDGDFDKSEIAAGKISVILGIIDTDREPGLYKAYLEATLQDGDRLIGSKLIVFEEPLGS